MATTMQLPESVTLAAGNGDLTCVRVNTPRCSGEVYLQGATVTAWTPAGSAPVLFLSERAQFAPGKAIRGGVPLCAPWFGKGRGNDKQPAHGFFRLTAWELTGARDDDGTVTLTFALDGATGVGAQADLTASYVVTLGDELDLALTITAGAADLDLEEALHTYFRVGDVEQVALDGLDGHRYADKAPGGRAVNAQSGHVRFTRETDRVYAHEGPLTLQDPSLGRDITITKDGSASTVVWNPWSTKSSTMDDFGDDEWHTMVCVETANALRGAITVPAGRSHTLRQHVSLTPRAQHD